MQKFTPRRNKNRMPESPTDKKPLQVILDSNALFVPLKFKIDIFAEVEQLLERNVEFILLSPVKQELERLADSEFPKMRKEAIYALKLAEKCKLTMVIDNANLLTDDIIIKVAEAQKMLVFTNDRQLRKRLRDISVPVIYVRQKSRLEIDGLT